MKKLISVLTVVFLVCTLCVPAFALSDDTVDNVESAYGTNYGEIYALYPDRAFDNKGKEIKSNNEVSSGSSIFYPIVVKNEDDKKWYFATSVSDIRDINVRLSKITGSKFIDGAEIVSKNLKDLNDKRGSNAGKVRCVEVKLKDYYGSKTEQDIAFNIQLREKSSVVFDSGDYSVVPTDFYVGQEADQPVSDKTTDSSTGYSGRMSGGLLKFTINDNTRVVKLDEFDGKDVKSILITGGNIDFTYEVDASDQKPLYLQVNDKADVDISDKYIDDDLYFINFPGEPFFDHLGTFSYSVPDPDKKYYMYQINGKNLEEVDARYDKDTECLVFKTRTLGSYVISEGSKLSAKPSSSTSDDSSENLTVGSTNPPSSGNDGTSVGATKPNFNSSDNNILDMMVVTAVVSAIGVCGFITTKKNYR